MTLSLGGLPSLFPFDSTSFTTSMPSTTSPNTTCFPLHPITSQQTLLSGRKDNAVVAAAEEEEEEEEEGKLKADSL